MSVGKHTYWDRVSTLYQRHTRIAVTDFHYGPLLEGDRRMKLLPADVSGLRCLEAGCGAGQNSIYLARRGADCAAVDTSQRQLAAGRALACRNRVAIDFRCRSIESLPDKNMGLFDLVHSVHALEFVDQPRAALSGMARMLKPGGVLLLATSHPLAASEPLNLGRDGMGVLTTDYYNPAPEIRGGRHGWPQVCARVMTFGELTNAVISTGCRIDFVAEPQPPALGGMSEAAIRRRIPYYSRAWRMRQALLAAVPFTIVVRAIR